jgi:hypothetical protein
VCYLPGQNCQNWTCRLLTTSSLRCLRRTASAVARVLPRRPRPHARPRPRPDPAGAELRGVPVGTYMIEQRDRQRFLLRLTEGAAGDEAL